MEVAIDDGSARLVVTTMRPADFIALLEKHFSPRERRVWCTEGRAHVELRVMDGSELSLVAEHLQKSVREIVDLNWAEVHQGTRRVVLSFRPGSFTAEQALAVVAEAELKAGLGRALWALDEHPVDAEQLEETFLVICAEAVGLLFSTTLKLSFIPRSRLAGTLASALLVVRAVPRLRRFFDERFGVERTDLGLALVASVLEGPAQRPLNSLVGLLEKLAVFAELREQKHLFEREERELCELPRAAAPRSIPERPVPLPRGPIEEYADRAWAVALGGFAVSFVSTRSVQRAFGALFGGIPRPARLGRETFIATLSRLFAARRMLVLDRDALRRLDRVDTLVIQGDLMPGTQISLGRYVAVSGDASAEDDVRALFDPKAPLHVQRSGSLCLGPVTLVHEEVPEALVPVLGEMTQKGELVLALLRDGRLEGLVEVLIRSRLGLEELVQSAHDARIQVIVASDDPEILQAIPADDTLGGGDAMWHGVRELQRGGSVVCVVAQGDSRAFDVADLGVAVVDADSVVPWSADVLCRDDLNDVRFLIEAAKVARMVSRQSVNVALGAATLGALASVGGLLPLTTNRVLTVVNLASLLSMGNGVRLAGEFSRRPLVSPRDPTPWHALSAEGVLTRLESSRDGLAKQAALARQSHHDRGRNPVLELATLVSDELFNPLVPLLAAGAALSAVVGSLTDAVMVGGVVGLNAVVGGFQRLSTERQLAELNRSAHARVQVRRDGKLEEISSVYLVKGDILLLSSGDAVPADCRIVESQGLEVDASGLTGESLPVAKSARPSFEESIGERSSMLYSGSVIARGQATAVVVATGAETEARRGAAAFRGGSRESGVERRMRELMDLTAPVALFAGAGVIGAGLLRGRKMDELVGSAVSLAVASVPEGLPLLATAAQLAAARRLSKFGALVRNVRALEALGRVDTVCVDKTGTVTEGTLALGLVSDGRRRQDVGTGLGDLSSVVGAALRASPPRPEDLSRVDPVEVALFREAETQGITPQSDARDWKRSGEIPFDAELGFTAIFGSLGADDGHLSVKGAPEILIGKSATWRVGGESHALDEAAKKELLGELESLTSNGYRVLGVAERAIDRSAAVEEGHVEKLEFLGILAFRDPVRKTAAEALRQLRRAGLAPVMITGDHPSTAAAVFTELGLGRNPETLLGPEIAALSEEELTARAPEVEIFARVSPSQKVRIVRALSRSGRTVAMVGDGANDAPAIRLAAVGVALGEHCSEAARNAADIVLKDAHIETLVHAIVEGRSVWESVRDAVSILVGGNLGEIGFTLLGGLVSGRPPLTPRQLLLVNLFTDVAPATALALRAPKARQLDALIDAGPDASLGEKLHKDIAARAVITASGAGAAWLASSFIGDRRGASTTALLALVGTQLGQTLSSGERSRQVVLTNVLTTLGLGLIIQTPGVSGTFGCRPLGPIGWTIAVSSSVLATTMGRYAPGVLEGWFPSHKVEWADFGLSDRTGRASQELGTVMAEAHLLEG